MKTIALYSIKGGVGKTAATVNLAYLAAQDGYRCLLCDLDAQGSASFYFRIRPPKKLTSKKLVKGGKHIDRSIKSTDFENLDLLPSNLSFRKLDLVLDNLKRSKKRLQEALRPLAKEYDLIFLDCPPNITLVSENIFVAADTLLVPIIPTTLSVLTFEKLAKFFKQQNLDRSKMRPFFSMVEKRKKLHGEIIVNLMNQKKYHFLESQIPYLSEVEKMGIHREPLLSFSPNSRAALAYQNLWQELKNR